MTKRGRLIVMIAVSIAILLSAFGLSVTAYGSQNYQNYQVVLNLLNGQQYFGVPHVYQGDINGEPTNQWPVYYGPNSASQYWSPLSSSINQPVLMMAPDQAWAAGAMFWGETYSGSSVTITMIGTFSNGSSIPVDGFEIYLFLKPTEWGISSAYNWSIPHITAPRMSHYPSPAAGDDILPQSSTSYLIIQWDPWWQFGYGTWGATGQWNVWIVSNPSGNNPSISPSPSPNLGGGYAGWDGIGTGAFQPNPGDRINITVTYNPSTNALTGIAIDLNTGQSANFILNLGNYYTPPSSGSYVFGIAGNTGGGRYANWALLYVAMIGSVKSPSPSPTYYSANFTEVGLPSCTAWVAAAVAVIVVLVLIIALLMGRRSKP